jgi:hypothetical protein
VLRYAILAFSSQHVNRFFDHVGTEAIEYHDKCLQLLKPVLSGPKKMINEDVLAAIAILRQYEEMDGKTSHLIHNNTVGLAFC